MEQRLLSSSSDRQRDIDAIDNVITVAPPMRSHNLVHASPTGSINSRQLPPDAHLADALSHKASLSDFSDSSSSSSGEVSKDVDIHTARHLPHAHNASAPSFHSTSLSDDDFDVSKVLSVNDAAALKTTKLGMDSIEEAELPRNATVMGSVANIANNVMGAGLLTLPWAMSRGTTVGSLLLYILVLLASSYTMYIISKACDATNVFSFRDLFRHCFGNKWGVVVQITVMLLVAGACVSYVVLIGDFIPHVFSEFPALRGTVLTNRAFVVSICAVVFLLPLSLLRDLNSLRHTSVLGIIAIMYAASLAVYRAFAAGEIHETVEHYRVTPSIFSTLALANTAFTAHFNAPVFYREMKVRTPANFRLAVILAFGLCAAVYSIVSVASYFEFGAYVTGDILNSYDQGRPESGVARIGMAFSVMMTFPLLMYATRSSFDTLVFGDRPYSRVRHYFEVICILPVIVVIGILFPKVELVLAYQGSTIGALIVYVYPCVLYLRLVDLPRWQDKLVPLVLIVFGVSTGAIATYTISIGEGAEIDLNWVASLGCGFLALTVALIALAVYRIRGSGDSYAILPTKS